MRAAVGLVVGDDFNRAVVIAVAVVRVVELAVHQVVGVVAVWNGFVPALWTMSVAGAGRVRGAGGRIGVTYGNGGLIHMVAVRRVKVAVVEVGDFVANADGGVAAAFAMNMRVAAVDGMVGAHGDLFLVYQRGLSTPDH